MSETSISIQVRMNLKSTNLVVGRRQVLQLMELHKDLIILQQQVKQHLLVQTQQETHLRMTQGLLIAI